VTATTSSPPAPAPAPGRSKVSLWVALAALAVGAIVAVLGVRAVIGSVQRDQQISKYAEARSTAQYFVENGNTISASTERLQVLNDEDLINMEDRHAALEAGDASRFNTLVAESNTRNAEQQSLHNQVGDFQDGFDEAFER